MCRWTVLWQAAALLAAAVGVGGTLQFRLFDQRRLYAPASQVDCFEYTMSGDRLGRALNNGWRPQKTAGKNVFPGSTVATFPTDSLLNINEISKRIDHLLPYGNDIVKEHAKLVQDINGLKQMVFVAPLVEDNKDYDDSIFHETLETFTTTTSRPTTTRPLRSHRPSQLPIILAGSASQRQVVKSQSMSFPKPTISLVGTSVSPLVKHPYPFVVQATARKPIKFCMTSMPMMLTTRRPALWQRLLNLLIPR